MCTYPNRLTRNRHTNTHTHAKPPAPPCRHITHIQISYILYWSHSAQKSQGNSFSRNVNAWARGGRCWAYLLLTLRWHGKYGHLRHLQVIAWPKTRSPSFSDVKNPLRKRMLSSFRMFAGNGPYTEFRSVLTYVAVVQNFVCTTCSKMNAGPYQVGTQGCRWELPQVQPQQTPTTLYIS